MAQLDLSNLQAVLTTRVFGRELTYLPRTGSTNDVAKELAAQGAPEGTVVVADEQTAGRGRLGRRWLAPPGTCLLCSILFRPNLPPTQIQSLTMLCALAATDTIKRIADLRVWLKWPNDLIVRSPVSNLQSQEWKKLAGLLTETGFTGKRLDYAIVGIGINVNVETELLPTLDPNATSLLAETSLASDRGALLAGFLAEVERRYEALQTGESPHQEWATRLATLGQQVRATTAGEILVGVAESVDKDGALLLRTPDGTLHRLTVGDVTLHPTNHLH
jgi:BirA family biotin operon repressor/biotin-[acetyl-CoA-carboxylase] ligase